MSCLPGYGRNILTNNGNASSPMNVYGTLMLVFGSSALLGIFSSLF